MLLPINSTLIVASFFTVTVHELFFLFEVVTVIFALPTLLAVILPFLFTVATFLLLLAHVTFLFEAVVGNIVAVSEYVFPTFIVTVFLLKLTDFSLVFTVTLHIAVFPLLVFAIISVVPFPLAVTLPFLSTVAIFSFFGLQVIVLFFVLLGFIVAFNVSSFVPLKSNSAFVLFKVIVFASISGVGVGSGSGT